MAMRSIALLSVLFFASCAHPGAAFTGSRFTGFRASLKSGSRCTRSSLRLGLETQDKTEVRNYFNSEGFQRWNRIYSEDGEVNNVQMDIRTGHQQTVDKILSWVDADADISGQTVCDAGCGVGSLAIPLAQRGAKVSASDISQAMADEAGRRAKEVGVEAEFSTADMETLSGKYDLVTCVDVMIHYPDDQMQNMVKHLASLSSNRMMISFAPKTWWFTFLKGVGGLFPGPSKTTRAYLHEEDKVRKAIKAAGFRVARTEFTGTSFYFSTLLECVREA